jgi:HSP20 family protein
MTRTRERLLAEPGTLLRRMFRDFDPWSEPRFSLAGLRSRTFADVPWLPPLEMTERDHRLAITLERPGLKKEDIAVNLTEEGLVIEGERAREEAGRENDWFTTERTYWRFYRVVPLPDGVNFMEVKATFSNGVLEISVPLPTTATRAPYKVPVEGDSEAGGVQVAA